MLVHSGDNHGGHYVVYLNPKGDGKVSVKEPIVRTSFFYYTFHPKFCAFVFVCGLFVADVSVKLCCLIMKAALFEIQLGMLICLATKNIFYQ